MTGATRVVMPRLGESIVEATIARWRVKVGERVERGQILAEVETDKATNELPAPAAGVVAELLAAEGAVVAVGTPIAAITPADAGAPATKSAPAASGTATNSTPAGANATNSAPANATNSAPAGAREGRLPSMHLADRGGPGRNSPAVRRLAREHRLDLNAIPGSGKNGRVTRDDVLRTLDRPAAIDTPGAGEHSAIDPIPREEATPFTTALPQPILEPATTQLPKPPRYAPKPGDQTIPFSRRRKQIAQHMLTSLQTSAHVFALAEIDMSRVIAAKNADAPHAEKSGLKLTFMPYVIAAVARALGEHPELNATVSGEALVLRAEKNIGVAVDTPEGLVVPVIRRANELGILGLARQLAELSDRARAGKLSADDISSGSFTISNPGRDGNLVGLSIIRQPEVAILRMGSIVKRAVVREVDGEDVIVVRPMMFAALSYDHRVIDGRSGNAFLSAVSELIAKTKPSLGA